MVLTVPIDDFAEAVKQHTSGNDAYLAVVSGHTVATAIQSDKALLVRAETDETVESTKQRLTSAGMKVLDGHWGEPSLDPSEQFWIGAVAYKSAEDTPGLWVHAFATKPSTGQVLAALYDEFRESGDIGEVPLEEFIRLADPNVVVLSPEEQTDFGSVQVERA